MKPTKCPAREKKAKKTKKGGGGKRKVKVDTAVLLLNLSRARTSQTDILHRDQKAVRCTTCKRLCGTFELFIARQWPENRSTSFKTRFSAKSPGAKGLGCQKKSWRSPKTKKKFLTRRNCLTLPPPPTQKWSTLMQCYVSFLFFFRLFSLFHTFYGHHAVLKPDRLNAQKDCSNHSGHLSRRKAISV